MVAPQVFHEKKLEVMVPESSRHLERFSGRSLISSKDSLNILPGSTRDKYWSQHTAFVMIHINSVERTRPPLPFATFRKIDAKEAIMPVQSKIPPKHIADRMMEIVHIMPCTLEEDSRLLSSSIIGEAPSGTTPKEIPLFMM